MISFLILLTSPEYTFNEKSNLKQTAVHLSENLNDVNNSVYTQWFLMPLDIIDSKIPNHPSS